MRNFEVVQKSESDLVCTTVYLHTIDEVDAVHARQTSHGEHSQGPLKELRARFAFSAFLMASC